MRREEKAEEAAGDKIFKVYLRWSRRKESRKQRKVKQEKQNNFIKTCSRVATPGGNEKHL